LISIITPVYNGVAFIRACIKAVSNQNCPDAEHVIVDGGSTDGTLKIIEELAPECPHLRWISESDKGQSDAMNKGINLAKGEIIGILNVDDFYEPNIFDRISEIFKSLPEPSLLVGNCNILDSKDRINKVNKPNKLNLNDIIMLRHPFPLNPSAYFYHKSLHERIGLYNVDEHFMMDLEFILKAVRSANAKYIDEIWGNHRQVQGSKTVTLKRKGQHSQYLLDFLAKQRKKLPLIYKLKLLPVKMKLRIQYFAENPLKFYPALINKIKRIF
jgi:glycosyltransferase involved in cell wall biosynthesis